MYKLRNSPVEVLILILDLENKAHMSIYTYVYILVLNTMILSSLYVINQYLPNSLFQLLSNGAECIHC